MIGTRGRRRAARAARPAAARGRRRSRRAASRRRSKLVRGRRRGTGGRSSSRRSSGPPAVTLVDAEVVEQPAVPWPGRRRRAAAARGATPARRSGSRACAAGQHVLHVRGLEELQPAVLHERDVAAGQLELERVAVVAGAEQHGLVAQRRRPLAVLEHAVAHERRPAAASSAQRERARAALHRRPRRDHSSLRVAPAAAADMTALASVEDGRRRAVVLLERDDAWRPGSARGTRACARADAARKP